MRFLLKFTLNRPPSEEIKARIPAEQRRGVELAEQAVREAVYIAANRSAVWTVWNCDSQEVLDEATKTLSLCINFGTLRSRSWLMKIFEDLCCQVIMKGERTWEKLFSI